MLLTLSATIAGAEDRVEIHRRGKLHLDFLRRFPPFAKGISNPHFSPCGGFIRDRNGLPAGHPVTAVRS
jgi:hypothetical protein